jgi:long-chain fatty acid transport protein
LFFSVSAHADPLDTFGFGARATGLAGAVTASASGAGAAHANPAGLALAATSEVLLGYGYGRMGLSIDGEDARVLDARGVDLGLAIPFRLGEVPVAVGAAIHLPDQFVVRVQLIPATEPHFILLDNDVHRIVVEPVAAVRPLPWLALGAGASILADAVGRSIRFDVGVVGGEPLGQGALDVELPPRVAPMAGLLLTPHPRVRIGASFRGAVDLALRLGILANVDIAGVVTGDVLIDLRAANFYTPRRLTGALSVDLLPDLTLSAELTWLAWSGFHGGAPDVRILVALGISPPLIETLFPDDDFQDTLAPRASLEWRPGRAALRAGYAIEPSPVPPQVGLTSFADNERHVFALGGGVTFDVLRPILAHPVSLDLGLQLHHLRERVTLKNPELFPGKAFSSGGDILRAALTLSVPL